MLVTRPQGPFRGLGMVMTCQAIPRYIHYRAFLIIKDCLKKQRDEGKIRENWNERICREREDSTAWQQACIKPHCCSSKRLVKSPASKQVQIYFMSVAKIGDQNIYISPKTCCWEAAQVGTGKERMFRGYWRRTCDNPFRIWRPCYRFSYLTFIKLQESFHHPRRLEIV